VPDFDDRLRRDVPRLSGPAESVDAFEGVEGKRRHRRRVRRTEWVSLVVVVALVAAGGGFALVRAFGSSSTPVSGGSTDRIVFVSSGGGTYRIATINPDGSGVRFVTEGRDGQPAWSPDGTRIAFVHEVPGGTSDLTPKEPVGDGAVWMANADGSDAHRVTDGPQDFSPTWSPDGTAIAFVRGGQSSYRIATVAPDGSDLRLLTPGSPEADTEPAWSPDGRTIAFVRVDPAVKSAASLWLVRSDGSDARQIVPAPGFIGIVGSAGGPLSWSRDGRRIAFEERERIPAPCPKVGICLATPHREVYVVDAHGSIPHPFVTPLTEPVPGSPGVEQFPGPDRFGASWAPDGRRVAFFSQASRRAGSLGPAPPVTLMVANADGSGRTPIVEGISGSGSPLLPVAPSLSWSPDSTRIAYAVGDQVHVVNSDGPGNRTLASGSSPSWPPAHGPIPPDTPETAIPPSASPEPTAAPTTEPAPSQTVSGYPADCEASEVNGRFEGGETEDTAIVAHTNCPPAGGQDVGSGWSVQVTYGSTGGGGVWDLPMCSDVCRAVAAADLNEDGVDEFVLEIDSRDSTSTVQLLALPFVETGPVTILVKHPTGGLAAPARFPTGGSVEQQAFLSCDTSADPLVISTVAALNADRNEYNVDEVTFSIPTDEGAGTGYPVVHTLIIESTDSSTVPFDPNGTEIPVRGRPCWDEAEG
jgi:Tol biopolymer transport system component